MSELRVVIPKSVTKPTSVPIENRAAAGSTRPLIATATTPTDQREGKIDQQKDQIAPVPEADREQQHDAHTCNRRMQEQLVAGCGLRLRLAAEDHVDAGRHRDSLRDGAASVGHERDHVPRRIAGHRLAPACALVEDQVAVARVVDIGQLAERHAQPVSVLQQQRAHGLRIAAAFCVQDHDHVRRLIRAVRLGDDAALVGRLHRVHHVDGPEAELREALRAQA